MNTMKLKMQVLLTVFALLLMGSSAMAQATLSPADLYYDYVGGTHTATVSDVIANLGPACADPLNDVQVISVFQAGNPYGYGPDYGNVTLRGSVDLLYTPTPGVSCFCEDTYVYIIACVDTIGGTNAAIGTGVVHLASALIASNDEAYAATEDVVLTVPVASGMLANDQFACDTNVWVMLPPASGVTNGTLTLSADGSFTYLGNTNFCGNDSFTYTISNGCGRVSGVATVLLAVAASNDLPTAIGENTLGLSEDITYTNLAPGLLANDTDVDSGSLCGCPSTDLTVVNWETIAGLAVNADGSWTYTPPLNFCGQTSFSYQVSDGCGLSDVVTNNITVNGVNDAPIADVQSFNGEEGDGVVAISGTITNFSDVDVGTSCGCSAPELLSVQLCITSSVGSIVLNSDGSFALTAPSNYCGVVSFGYQVTDGCLTSACVTATVDIDPVNDAPVAIIDGPYSISETDTLTVASTVGLLVNDSDPDAANDCGCTTLVAAACSPRDGLIVNADGSFTYDPPAGTCGPTSFYYQVSDGCSGGTSECVQISINVLAENDCPVRTNFTDVVTNLVYYFSNGSSTTAIPNGVTNVFTSGQIVYQRFVDPDAGSNCGATQMFWSADIQSINCSELTVLGSSDLNARQLQFVVDPSCMLVMPTNVPCGPGVHELEAVATVTGLVYVTDTSGECLPGEPVNVLVNVRVVNTITNIDHSPVAPNYTNDCISEDSVLTIDAGSLLLPAYLANPDDCCSNFVTALVGCCLEVVPECPGGSYEDLVLDFWPVNTFTQVVDGVTNVFTGTDLGHEVTTVKGGKATLDGSQIRYTPPANWPLCDSDVDFFPYVVKQQTTYGFDPTTKWATGLIQVCVQKVCDAPVTVADSVALCEDTTKSIAMGDLVGNDYDVDFAPSNLVAYTGNENISIATFGSAALPGSVGGFSLTPMDPSVLNALTDFDLYTTIDMGSCQAGQLTFSPDVEKRNVPSSWGSWSHSYTGGVLMVTGNTMTIDLPANITAFGLHINPSANVGPIDIQVVANDGTSTSLQSVVGFDTAGFVAYAGKPGQTLARMEIAASSNVFAVSEFAFSIQPIAYVMNVGGMLGPTNGELIIDGYVGPVGSIATNLQYRPEPNFYGTDSFSYTLCTIEECEGDMVTNYVNGLVNVAVHPVSDLTTVATDDQYPGVEDTALTISMASLLSNDTDGGDQGLNAANLVPEVLEVKEYAPVSANGGTISMVGSNLVYTPALNFYGQDTFTYVAGEVLDTMKPACQVAQPDMATVTICVAPVNDPSVPSADNYAIDENELIVSTVATNDSDVEGQMSFYLHPLVNVTHGRLTFNVDGSFTYLPATNWNGTDGFTYYVVDGGQTNVCGTSVNNTSAPVRVYIQVADVNSAPTADNKSIAVDEDRAANVQLTGRDVEEYGYVASFLVKTGPSHGTVTPGSGAGSSLNVIYRPSANYCGSDSFTYVAIDNIGVESAEATVSIDVDPVNDAPVAIDDAVTTPEDTGIVITPAANDTDADTATVCGSAINRIQIADQPQHGTVIKTGMSIAYTPAADFCGEDQFTYIVYDGANASDEGAVVITVTPVNDTPVANDLVINTEEDKPVSGQVTASDDDFGTCQAEALSFAIESNGAKGVAVMNPDGSFTYTPNGCANGADAVTYRVTDSLGAFDIGQIAITIVAINDSPVATDDSATTAEDVPVTVDVLANDEDGDCEVTQVLNVVIASGPSYGTAQVVANQIVYTPASNYFGPDALSYYITDVTGQPDSRQSGVANVSITVTAVNDQPVADSKAVSCIEDQTTASVTPTGVDVEDGQALTYAVVALPMHGSVVTNAGGQFVYTPATDYCGPDSFSYVAIDTASLASAPVVVTIAVECTADEPTAMNQSTQTFMRVPVAVTVPAADTDLGYTNASAHNIVILSSLASNGTVEVDGLVVTFSPSSAFKGQHVIEYKLVDGEGAESTNYTITVNVVVKRGVLGDFNADGAADLSVVHKALVPGINSDWYVRDADSGAVIINGAGWGWNATVAVPADYDGDGTTDRAMYQEATGNWFILSSNGIITVSTWGYAGAMPVPADYDGDGITDLAVMDRVSFIWYVRQSTDGQMKDWQWGYDGCVPVPADYDGDGVSDRAVYNANIGVWYIIGSKGTYGAISWGWAAAKPAPADFNGDGSTDLGVVFNGVWYTMDYATKAILGFGDVTGGVGVAVPADYDGDGAAERAVYNETTGIWTIQDVGAQAWGFPGAKPAVTPDTTIQNY